MLFTALYIQSVRLYKHYTLLPFFHISLVPLRCFPTVSYLPQSEGLLETFIPPKIKLRGREVCEALPPQKAPSL